MSCKFWDGLLFVCLFVCWRELTDSGCACRYNAGHLIEAALAHSNYYKNNRLIEPIEKYVKLISTVIGPGPHQVRIPPPLPFFYLCCFFVLLSPLSSYHLTSRN